MKMSTMLINVSEELSIILIIILFGAISFPHIQSYYYKEREDYKGISQYLEEHSQTGDIIVIDPYWAKPCLLYYYNPTPKNNTIKTIETDLTKLKDIISKNERVWVIFGGPWDSEVRKWLYSRYGLGEKFTGESEIFVYLIQPSLFKAAIFHNLEWSPQIRWMSLLGIMGASMQTFNDTIPISNINLTEFDVVVFADFLRPLNESERTYLQESIKNGSIVIISGTSPERLAGGTTNLTTISSWFGATDYLYPLEMEKRKVKFTNKATEIMKDLNLEYEYRFYTDGPWSTPIGCIVQNESDVYAYRKNDGAATIFLHNFGDGVSIFIGPRWGFDSPDRYTFKTFLELLIRSVLANNQG